jgi:hypothetical protein
VARRGWLFFASACQLLLSFGPVHIGKFGGPAAWAAPESGDASAEVPPLSPQRSPMGLAGGAICANTSLPNTLVTQLLAII